MTTLVTGGAGFIGSQFVRLLRARRPDRRVVNLDALTYAGHRSTLADLRGDRGHVFVRGDIADPVLVEDVFARYGVDEVVNFAAESHVDRSIDGPGVFLRTNVIGTQTLLEAARRHAVRRFVQISTDEVYGALGPEGRFTEDSPIQPSSPYSASKASADLMALAWGHTFGVPVSITRCSNNYGPYQFPEKLIPVMVTRALADLPLPVYGDGSNVRDWIRVEDHCEAVLAVLEGGQAGRVYNVGADSERSNLQLVRALLDVLGKPASLITFVKDRPGHDWRYAIDASRIRDELGWAPKVTFEDGIAATVRWYLERRDWWEPLVARQRKAA